MTVSGSLEEIDGHQIRPPGPERHGSWLRAVVTATVLAASRPPIWVYALAAFLARGGILVLAIPIIAPPSFIDLVTFVGPTSVTAAGPTPGFVALVAGAVAALVVAIVAGTVAAAAAEVAFHRAAVASSTARETAGRRSGAGEQGPDPGAASATGATSASGVNGARSATRRAIARIVAIRLALLLPLIATMAAAVPQYVAAGYQELSLPSDVRVPLFLRIVAGAPAITITVVVAWLVAEVVGGLAARHIVLNGSGAGRAAVLAVGDVGRHPASTLLTLLVALAGTVALLVPTLMMVAGAWDRARISIMAHGDGTQVIGAVALLAISWLGLLLIAGWVAAWRGSLWTAELERRTRTPG